MTICKRPAKPDDQLQEAGPFGWSFARGRPLWMIICKRPDNLDDHLQEAGHSEWSTITSTTTTTSTTIGVTGESHKGDKGDQRWREEEKRRRRRRKRRRRRRTRRRNSCGRADGRTGGPIKICAKGPCGPKKDELNSVKYFAEKLFQIFAKGAANINWWFFWMSITEV